MMRIVVLSIFLLISVLTFTTSAQNVKARDVLIEAPDSVFELLTRNNKLDLVDFAEAGMESRVKDRLDGEVYLDTLSEDYLFIRTSSCSSVEILLLSDSIMCVNRTYAGPVQESEVRLYGTDWTMKKVIARPSVKAFMKHPNIEVESEAEYLPLISAKLSPADRTLTWKLQSEEFSKETKKVANECLQPVVVSL